MYTRTGLPVTKCQPHTDYPVDAFCMICQQPITRESFITYGATGAGNWQLKYDKTQGHLVVLGQGVGQPRGDESDEDGDDDEHSRELPPPRLKGA